MPIKIALYSNISIDNELFKGAGRWWVGWRGGGYGFGHIGALL